MITPSIVRQGIVQNSIINPRLVKIENAAVAAPEPEPTGVFSFTGSANGLWDGLDRNTVSAYTPDNIEGVNFNIRYPEV